MTHSEESFHPIERSELRPDIIGVLDPGEEVYWYEKPPRKKLLPAILGIAGISAFFLWQEGYLDDPTALFEGASTSVLVAVILFFVVLIGGFIGVHYYHRDAFVYVLTSQRVMRLFRGQVAQQATPEKLRLRGSPRRSRVLWYNDDYPPDSESRGRYGFANVKDGIATYGLLETWQKAKLEQSNQEALAGSESFRRESAAAAVQTDSGPVGDAASKGSESARTIQHPGHGFTLEAPAEWNVLVGQERDAPVKLLGVTIIKRLIRPARLEPYRAGEDTPWNRMVIRGGPSVGLTLKVNPGRMYEADEVLQDRMGKRLGVAVQSVERDIEIAGFRGFAVVRELPAGSSLTGFGNIPLPVISRQWWLTLDDLNLEIQGLAPSNSVTLQETVDLMVGSLRPGSSTA